MMDGFDNFLDTLDATLDATPMLKQHGKVVEVIGTLLKVGGLDATLGELCELREADGRLVQRAEVVGFTRQFALLAPFGSVVGLSRSTRVVGQGRPLSVPVGPALMGRVLDGLGEPLDQLGAIET